MGADEPLVVTNPWQSLRRFTAARIALGRAGVSIPTGEQLDFRLAHARARDAVHLPFDAERLAGELQADGVPQLVLASAAGDRHIYLQRPDLGRRLDDASRERLLALRAERNDGQRHDLAFVIADGLSALAVHEHALPLLAAMRGLLPLADWCVASVAIVRQGRVAIGDEIGELLDADCVVVLIGERPGLSSPDSLGLYVTWSPRVGLTDAARNCISNVRPAGLAVDAAATKLRYLLGEARNRRLTGVGLKDEADDAAPVLGTPSAGNFLLESAPSPAEPAIPRGSE